MIAKRGVCIRYFHHRPSHCVHKQRNCQHLERIGKCKRISLRRLEEFKSSIVILMESWGALLAFLISWRQSLPLKETAVPSRILERCLRYHLSHSWFQNPTLRPEPSQICALRNHEYIAV